MYSIEEYNNQAIKLSQTLIVKLLDVAIAMNKGLTNQYDNFKISDDKKTWKYFLNLSGQKHYLNPEEEDETKKVSTNTPVLITITELGSKQLLTKEILEKYPYTKSELLKQEDTYNNLLKEYPSEIVYIHGCMFPIDINTAIEAKEGTILAYNTNLVETNEKYLIPELQNFIQNFLVRWHIKEYTIVEDLYLPSMVATLFSSLPAKINNLRLEKIFTNEVHSFHLEHFFRSHLDIWDELDYVNDKTKYWLYRNLPYLIRNLGKKNTLDVIINKILTENDVGIGEYTLNRTNVTLNENAKPLEPVYNPTELNLYASSLNSSYSGEGSKDLTSILTKQLDKQLIAVEKEEDGFIIERELEKIKASQIDNQRTKIIELSTNSYYKRYGIDLFKIVFDYWVYGVKSGTLQLNAEFLDPNTSQPLVMNAKQGLLLLIKFILYNFGHQDLKITDLHYDLVFEKDNSCIDNFKHIMFAGNYIDANGNTIRGDGYTNLFFTELKNNFPNVTTTIGSISNFKSLLQDVLDYSSYLWIVDANSENAVTSASMKALLYLITQRGTYTISDGQTIDDILDKEQCNVTISSGYNITSSITTLVNTFTGLNLNEFELTKNITENYKSLLEKLTAYTTQIMTQDAGEDAIHVYYNNINIFRSKIGIININESVFKPLEENYAKVSAVGINLMDTITGFVDNNIGIRTSELQHAKLFTGQVELYNNQLYSYIAPQFQVEVVDESEYTYDAYLGLKYFDSVGFKPLDETMPGKLDISYRLEANPLVDNTITFRTQEFKINEFIQGAMEVHDNKSNTWVAPTFNVSVEDPITYKVDASDTDIFNK